VLGIAIAPATCLATQRVFYAETSSLTSDRLTPRIADTAKILVSIYLTLSAVGFAAYLLAGTDAFDAVNHTFTSIATGGFSTRNASIAAFDSVAVEVVAIVLMAAGGINFAFYWRALRGRDLWPQAAEVRLFLAILLGSIVAVTASLAISATDGGIWEHLRSGAFSATTVLTGTGYTTDDFDAYNDFARSYLLLIMFVGGCAGSTAGGLKVIRVMLLGKTAAQEVQRQLRPRAVQVLRTRGRVFSDEIRRGVLGFFYIYMAVFLVSTLALAATGLDGLSAISGAAACLNLLGPAMGELGAADNYQAAPDAARGIFTFLMLAGRLEVFTVLVLLTPAFWRPNVA
jgi:trk system potassium uptake protein